MNKAAMLMATSVADYIVSLPGVNKTYNKMKLRNCVVIGRRAYYGNYTDSEIVIRREDRYGSETLTVSMFDPELHAKIRKFLRVKDERHIRHTP